MSCEISRKNGVGGGADAPSLLSKGDLDVHDVGGVAVVEGIGVREPMVLEKLPGSGGTRM